MSSSSSLLSEDQLLCPICLGVFVKPVSTPCGHNFCMSCLSSYWDSSSVCLCPVCKDSFSLRPQLRVNTFISGLSQSFSSRQLRPEPPASVLCDVCTAPQQDAQMSCVECLTSFCSDHLEPHHRVPGLRRHTLIPPDTSLQDRVCPQHQQPLHSYCPEEGALLCVSCEGAHSRHRTLPLEQACRELRAQLGSNEAKVSSLIQERVQSVCSIRDTKAQRHEETRRVITQSEEVLQDVLKNHKDLVLKLEEKQQQADSEAEALVAQTEQEIKDLIETQTKLQEVKQIQDPLLFLQKHPNMPLMSWSSLSTLSLKEDEELEEMWDNLESCTTQMKEFPKKFNRIVHFSGERQSLLKPLWKHAVDLKLDPDTAHPRLLLSPDLKQVWFNKRAVKASGNNSRRFLGSCVAIADKGFTNGRFYFEVCVEQKEEFVVGLVSESVPREKALPRKLDCGVWALYFRVDKFYTFYNREVPVHRGKVERVGVFVDCDKGLLSFHDVKTATCIYSFNNWISKEKMYPFLNPCDDEFPSNFGPMTIVDPK